MIQMHVNEGVGNEGGKQVGGKDRSEWCGKPTTSGFVVMNCGRLQGYLYLSWVNVGRGVCSCVSVRESDLPCVWQLQRCG